MQSVFTPSFVAHLFIACLVFCFFGFVRYRYFRFYPWLILPGTFAHEALHLLVGLVLGARPVRFSIWPTRSDGGYTLGYVLFANLRWWNKIPVGAAPILLFPISAELLWFACSEQGLTWPWACATVGAAEAAFAGVPSKQDFLHILSGAAICLGLITVAYLAYRSFM